MEHTKVQINSEAYVMENYFTTDLEIQAPPANNNKVDTNLKSDLAKHTEKYWRYQTK